MTPDTHNPFAPPAASLSDSPSEGEDAEPLLAPPVHRLTACIVGLALGFGLYLASTIVGQIIAETVGIAATLSAWEPMDYAPGAVFLLFYAPYALRRLARTRQTLPFRIFGLRFAKPGGGPVETWRILLLHGLLSGVVFWAPVLAASALRLHGPLDGILRFGGLVLLCANALSSRRVSGRTWMDEVAGLRVLKL